MFTKLKWIGLFCCCLAFGYAQDLSPQTAAPKPPKVPRKPPPKPGVSAPGVKRDVASIEPAAVFHVGGAPDWQVVTEDAVWISNAPLNMVHRLDIQTNQIAANIVVGKKPCSGLAAGFGSIWVPNCGDKTVSRIDIATMLLSRRSRQRLPRAKVELRQATTRSGWLRMRWAGCRVSIRRRTRFQRESRFLLDRRQLCLEMERFG